MVLDADGICSTYNQRATQRSIRSEAVEYSAGVVLAAERKEQNFWREKLCDVQKQDFSSTLNQLDGKPFFITLLNPNAILDCVPKDVTELMNYANTLGFEFTKCRSRMDLLRGLSSVSALANQEVYEALICTQIKALCAAAISESITGRMTVVRPMIPVIGTNEQIDSIADIVSSTIDHCLSVADRSLIDIKIGALIMLPR